MDLIMPALGGDVVINLLRRNGKTARAKFVLVSGKSHEELWLAASAAGADAAFLKGLCVRRPKLVALFAIANKLAQAAFRVITTKDTYRDLGASYLDQRDRDGISRKLLRRLLDLGLSREEVLRHLPRHRAPALKFRLLEGPFS